jgi:hypothetical protein
MIKGLLMGAGCVCLALAGCSNGDNDGVVATSEAPSVSPSATPSGPVVLTTDQAADRYLLLICKSNGANEALVATGYYDSYLGQPLDEQQKNALKKMAKANAQVAQDLEDEGYVWPEQVKEQIDRVAVQLYELSATARSTAKSGEAQVLSNGPGKSATIVRLKLGLPPRGKGCGKQ